MSSLDDIYDDMTGRAMDLGFGCVLEHLAEKPLRVVTVCSGTESPLLALEMVQKSMYLVSCNLHTQMDTEECLSL